MRVPARNGTKLRPVRPSRDRRDYGDGDAVLTVWCSRNCRQEWSITADELQTMERRGGLQARHRTTRTERRRRKSATKKLVNGALRRKALARAALSALPVEMRRRVFASRS